MRKQLFILISIEILIIISVVLFVIVQLSGRSDLDTSRIVIVKKTKDAFQLFRNGKPFNIQGAGGNSHCKELAEIGGNTMRVYDTINLGNTLDEAAKYGLAVIVDIPIPVNRYGAYSSEISNNILKRRIRTFVKKYKEHPAVLIWNLGNEVNYPVFSWKYFFRRQSFINTFNELIDIVHDEDPSHPVSTSLWNTSVSQLSSIRIFSPKLDILSFNVFGDVKNFDAKIRRFFLFFNAVPYYFSEFGSDGYWESKNTSWLAPIEQTSTKKVEQINNRYKFVTSEMHGGCLGALVFFWGEKYEHTYSWFSFFMDGYKSEIIKEIKYLWNKSTSKPSLIGLNYMLVDGKGAADNIIFAPNKLVDSEILFMDGRSGNDSLTVKWEIYPEGWHFDEDDMFIRPKPLKNSFISMEKEKATFVTPDTSGPYRIFVYVYDNHGYFASTNTPFYVLSTK